MKLSELYTLNESGVRELADSVNEIILGHIDSYNSFIQLYEGLESIDISSVADSSLGKWILKIDNKKLFTPREYVMLDGAHRVFHNIADMIIATKNARKSMPMNKLVELGEANKIIIEILLDLTKQILKTQFNFDHLTGLLNRSAITLAANNLIEKIRRDKSHKVFVAIADIDKFKKVNDTYGHNAGDEVLKAVSSIMKNSIRSEDYIARWGGEEYLIILDNLSLEKAISRLESIRDAIESNVVVVDGKTKISVTISFGLTILREDGLLDTINIADENLYKSKETGRNKITTDLI
jgi:diguanylate cyclase (GGDEF)-like protein